MFRRPWTVAQFAVAAVLLALSLLGIIGTFVLNMTELTFTFAGAIQALGVFPGLVLSLVLNGVLMGLDRAPAPNLAQRILVGIEFGLIALLLVFHFFQDDDAYTFGFAILVWVLVILVAVVVAVLAMVQLAAGRSIPAPVEVPTP